MIWSDVTWHVQRAYCHVIRLSQMWLSTNLSIFRWKRSHGIDNRHSSPQWTTMEILIWRRLSDEQTSDDVGQIGSYDDQMISVSIRILLRRGTGDIKAAIELKSFQKLEGAWKTLEGSGKTSRAAFSRWTNRLVGVWKKRECRLGNLICWETYSICKLQCLQYAYLCMGWN